MSPMGRRAVSRGGVIVPERVLAVSTAADTCCAVPPAGVMATTAAVLATIAPAESGFAGSTR